MDFSSLMGGQCDRGDDPSDFSLSFLQILCQFQVIYFGNSEKNAFYLIIHNIFVSLYLPPSLIWLVIVGPNSLRVRPARLWEVHRPQTEGGQAQAQN